MPANLDPRTRQALAEILQEALARGEAVRLPGFGTFRVAHRSAELERNADGRISIRPPHRSIIFESED